jgi:nickel transport protein
MRPVLPYPIFKSNLAKVVSYLFLVVGFLLVRIEFVDAHRVNLFAWIEGDTVHLESKFSGGKKVKAGKIIVTDPQGNELVKGTTDEKGEYTFKIPQKTDLKIVLIAGTGHRAEWTIAASEIEMPVSEKKPVPEKKTNLIGIIIGMGCIFGLTGIVAYIRRRKRKD